MTRTIVLLMGAYPPSPDAQTTTQCPDSSIQTSRIMGDTLGLTPTISSTLGGITSSEDEELLLGPTCDQSDLTTKEVNELWISMMKVRWIPLSALTNQLALRTSPNPSK